MAYKIFTDLPSDDISIVQGTEVTTGLWSGTSGDTGSLNAIYTSSVQVGVSGEFYYDLYNGSDPTTSDIQFSVSYGHVYGSGSPSLDNLATSTLPTQVVYNQYRNILLEGNSRKFSFGGVESDDIYVINISRSRLKQALDPGNWQIALSGSNGLFTFVDDSGLTTAVVGNLIVDNYYGVKSGSLASTNTASNTVYGTVFPDYGIIILNPSAVTSTVGFITTGSSTVAARTVTSLPFTPYTGSQSSTSIYHYQHEGLVRSISKAMSGGRGFIARSAETIRSTNYFIRLRNNEYNYSNNPTYYTGSVPRNVIEPFRVKPVTYVTTIGLYNNTNELLAVAKLSKPIQKSSDKEALIRVRLDY